MTVQLVSGKCHKYAICVPSSAYIKQYDTYTRITQERARQSLQTEPGVYVTE